MTSITSSAVNATEGLRDLLMTWPLEDLVRAVEEERGMYAAEVLGLMEEELLRRGISPEEHEHILHQADRHNAAIQAAQSRGERRSSWTAPTELLELFSIFF
jgi:hypothetical protein